MVTKMSENFRFGQAVRDLKTGTRGVVMQVHRDGNITYMTGDACDVTVPQDTLILEL